MLLSEKIEWLKGWASSQSDIRLCSRILDVCEAAKEAEQPVSLERCASVISSVNKYDGSSYSVIDRRIADAVLRSALKQGAKFDYVD